MSQANSSSQTSGRGLPWLANRLNQKLSITGKQMIIPLDLRHPLGNHVLINHDWSQEDKDSFSKEGYMSLQAMIGSRWASDTIPNAVVLRFIDGY